VLAATESEDGPFAVLGEYEVKTGGDARREARRQAVNDPANKPLKERILNGEPTFLVAVPRSSFQVIPAAVNRPAPKLVI
jgi:hypothetical protein